MNYDAHLSRGQQMREREVSVCGSPPSEPASTAKGRQTRRGGVYKYRRQRATFSPSLSSSSREKMVSSSAAVLLVGCLFFSCGALAAADFDFFFYVLSWPGAYCSESKEGCCLPTTGEPELDFFMKGLYTYNYTSTNYTLEPVTKCNDTKFYVNALRKLIGDMYSYMPSIECPSNNGVSGWESLWYDYGVCSGLDETLYFNSSLLLRSRINLLPKLRRLDVLPDGRSYTSGFVQAAINDAIGVKTKTKIRCTTDLDGVSQLSEIWMCVDTDATTLIACPAYPSFLNSTCADEIVFATFTYDMLNDTSLSFNPIQKPTFLSE